MYQMKWLEGTYNHDQKSIAQSIAQRYPHARYNEVLPVINGSTTTLHLAMVDLRDKANWWPRKDTMFPTQTHLEPRTTQLLKNFYHKSLLPDVRLVEGIFPLGMKEVVHLTVALQFMNDRFGGMFKVVHGIARYGCVPLRGS